MELYRLSNDNIQNLAQLPETGMGYQIITAVREYIPKEYIVFNCEFALVTYGFSFEIPEAISLHLKARNYSFSEIFERESTTITLSNVELKSKSKSFLAESNKGAKDGNKEKANGDELFVRLSAFKDDRRVDKKKKCLLPGSFTTTASDALRCKIEKDDADKRYALPSELKIEWAFFIQPKPTDELQRGIVQEAFGKKGGGKEAYFDKGTSFNTFITQTEW